MNTKPKCSHFLMHALLSLTLVGFALSKLASTAVQTTNTAVDDYREVGAPFITNYHPKDYGENPMNWAILEDDRGLLYVANLNGVLEFDGVTWRQIPTPKGTWVLSLEKDEDGTIYVGSFGDFGYLAPDSLGNTIFVSLLDKVKSTERNFQAVWRVHATSEGVYFWTARRLFRWSERGMQSWAASSSFSLSSVFNDTLYLEEGGKGLLKMVGDSLRLIPESKKFTPIGALSILPYDEGRALIAGNEGLLLFDGMSFSRFISPANKFLQENILSSAVFVPGGKYVFGTYKAGACVVDKSGNIVGVIDKAAGLQNDDVKNLYSDGRGAVWFALNSGISRVQLHDPISYFGEAQGLKGNVVSVARYDNTIYTATSQSVFYLVKAESEIGKQAIFKQVKGIEQQGFWLLPTGNGLLAGINGGVFKIEGTRGIDLNSQGQTVFVLTRSTRDTNRVYAGLNRGLEIFELINNRWQTTGVVTGIEEEIRSIAEDEDGAVWLGTIFQGVLKVSALTRNAGGWTARIERFDKRHGLPDGPANVTSIGGIPVFATKKGHRIFDPMQSRFVPDSTVSSELADTLRSAPLVNEDRFGRVFTWPTNKEGVVELWMATPQKNRSYLINKTRFRALSGFGIFHTTYTDHDGIIWIGCSTGLIRYDPGVEKNTNNEYSTLIRRVATIPEGSLIFGGVRAADFKPPVMGSKNNALRFEYAAPHLEQPAANRYQYQLVGFDEGWSDWTVETRKDYTNLPGGDYIFKVRASNVYGTLSREANFVFEVLPPWYKSPWTIAMFIILGGAAIFGLVRLRVNSLEKKSKALEEVVAQRTAEVTEQRNQLREQSERLQELDKLKSRFFANISHEFRTPLTIILGLVDKFQKTAKEPGHKTDFQVMQRNATRLLELINQLLELSRLEAGRIQLSARRGDIVSFLKRILVSFASLSEQEKISLTFNGMPAVAESGHAAIFVYFDPEKIEKVFYNLLSNAIKFNHEGGEVGVTVSSGSFPGNDDKQCIEINVRNTGAGIPTEDLPYVFDRFYQADSGNTRRYEGSGIGLALVKELIELHGGEVTVSSSLGEETTFTIRIPLGRAHLKDDEIVEGETETIAISPDADAPTSQPLESEDLQPISESETEQLQSDETLILVVEDHADLRNYIRENLTADYSVIEAHNGASGLQKAAESIPDLVISDIMMPEMDGYELCKALKTNEKTSHVPIILLTAKASRRDKLEGLETGADDYLIKPFDPKELQARVRNLIQSRRQMREKFSTEMLLRPTQKTVPSIHKVFLERITEVIEKHLDDESFSVETLGHEVGMSRAQIHRKLRALTNQSASEFIRSFRLHRAADLIKQDAGNIAEIAYQVGFSSQAYFSRCFQEVFGCSPSEYRKRQ